MIETLHLDKQKYPYGCCTHYVDSSEIGQGKSYRADYYQVFWVKSGQLVLHIDEASLEIAEGECSFIGPNHVYSIETDSAFEVMLLRFTETFYCRHEIDIHFLESCTFFDNASQILKFRLHATLVMILAQYHQSLAYICTQPFDELMYHFAHNTVERVLLFSLKEVVDSASRVLATHKKADLELANHFRQLVKEHSKKQKQVQYYADEMQISVKRLNDICNAVFGQPPKKIITERLLLEAKRLLQHSNMNVKEIAFDLMFQEPTNFIRFFINGAGMTPKEYREQFRI